jgi:DNA polymerase IV
VIACALIREYAVAVTRQDDPALCDVPLALVDYGMKRGRVAAVSPEAQRVGLQIGLSPGRARALCPDVHLLPLDEARLRAADDRLLEVLWTFTNRVEIDDGAYPQQAVCSLDLGRLKAEDAGYLGERLIEEIGAQTGMSASVGLARGKFPAYIAALSAPPDEVMAVPRGEEAGFVAPHPVDLLPLSKDAARTLRLLYIRTLGELAALPRQAISGQFGRTGKLLHLLASGHDPRPVNARRQPAAEMVTWAFDDPISDRTRLDAVIHHLAGEMAGRLDMRVSALHALALTLHLEDGIARTERLHLLQPVASAQGVAETVMRLVDRKKITGGVVEMAVCATHLVPNLPRQLELFAQRPARGQLIHLARTLAERHGDCFYAAAELERSSLLPERRCTLQQVEVS